MACLQLLPTNTEIVNVLKFQMRKSRRSQHKKPKDDLFVSAVSAKTRFAIDLFIQVWEHLHKLHHGREKFALFWMWRREDVFELFVKQILGIRIQKWSKGLLYNGYNRCRAIRSDALSPESWELIDSLFMDKGFINDLPNPIVHFIDLLSSLSVDELHTLQKSQVEVVAKSTHFSFEDKTIELLDPHTVDATMDAFLGHWTSAILQQVNPQLRELCQCYPSSFVTLDSTKNYTAFYDRQGGGCKLIVMILRQNVWTAANAELMRMLFIDLFAAHDAIERSSCASLDSEMKGFGPFWHSWVAGGGTKVSFYTHAKKLSKVLKTCTSIKQFGLMADRYAHEHVTSIMLALFLWWMPEALSSFFAYSSPFMKDTAYALCDLEKALGVRGPSAYQLYITKDYCSEPHKDVDEAEYTLCYASHPDCGEQSVGRQKASPVEFILADYGFILPIRDKNLYMFRSNVTHGTGYRVPSKPAAYIGCVTVNSALSSLMKRRQVRKQQTNAV